MAIVGPSTPLNTPLVEDPKTGLIAKIWNVWFLNLQARADQTANVLKTVTLMGQTASIAPTAFPVGALSAGLYRVSWYARVTTPATTSSSLQVTMGWTESAIACALSGNALTGNLTTTTESGVVVVLSDQSAPLLYSTTYASVGGTAMVYRLTIVVEALS